MRVQDIWTNGICKRKPVLEKYNVCAFVVRQRCNLIDVMYVYYLSNLGVLYDLQRT